MTRSNEIKRSLVVDEIKDKLQLEQVLKALDSSNRMRILGYLADRVASVSELAAALELPASSAALHIEVLENAGLIHTELEPAAGGRGLQKVCTRMFDRVVLDLPLAEEPQQQAVEVSMPVGAFVECQVTPTCGLLSDTAIIGLLDDPASFYEPGRLQAQLLWFHTGYVEYRFPNRIPANTRPYSLRLSMEICSEAPLYNLNWPSDITLWINDIEIGTWTSPADFGGERGGLTPAWWTVRNTQYGLLKFWQVNLKGSEIDGLPMSKVKIDDLKLDQSFFIRVKIGIKPTAEHKGGLNLFGCRFGNYPQDLVLHISYQSK
jgi:predicted transcriptional regulator